MAAWASGKVCSGPINSLAAKQSSATSAPFFKRSWKSTAADAEDQRDCERATHYDPLPENCRPLIRKRLGDRI